MSDHPRDAFRPRADRRLHRRNRSRRATGFKIVGAIDVDPAKVGRDLGDVAGLTRRLGVKVQGDAAKALQGRQARRRRSLHELVAQDGPAAARDDPEGEDADRLDDRGAVVSRLHAHPPGPADPRVGEEGEGGGARHRRQSGLRDGRAADHADGRLRTGRSRHRQPGAGRADPAAAVPAEDRRRPDHRAVSAEGRRRHRPACRVDRVDRDDCRRARMDARSDHRRHPAEARRR